MPASIRRAVKLMGWRRGKKIGDSYTPIDMGSVIKEAEQIFQPDAAQDYVSGVVAGYGYQWDYNHAQCRGDDWGDYFSGKRQSKKLQSYRLELNHA